MRHLGLFVVLGEELHLARRGPAVRVAAGLSQTIKQLEDATGLRLLDRTTRRRRDDGRGSDYKHDRR